MEEFNLDYKILQKRIEEINKTPENKRKDRVIKIVNKLNKIEDEIANLQKTLIKVWHIGLQENNENLIIQTANNLESLEMLRLKIQKAKLNLTLKFI